MKKFVLEVEMAFDRSSLACLLCGAFSNVCAFSMTQSKYDIESSFHEWKCPRGLLALAVKRLAQLRSRTARSVTVSFLCSLQIVSWYSFSSFVKSPYTCLYMFTYMYKLTSFMPSCYRPLSNHFFYYNVHWYYLCV